MNKAQRDIRRKKWVLEHAARIGNVRKTYRYFGVARSGFYVWKKAYETDGDEGLVKPEAVPGQPTAPYAPRHRREDPPSSPYLPPRPHPHRLVSRALSRHHDFESRRLPHPPATRPESLTQSRRATSGAHAPVRQAGPWAPRAGWRHVPEARRERREATRRYQHTASDDAPRIRALKVSTRHTQKNAMHVLDYVIKRFRFGCIRYGATVAMSSKPRFIGT